MKKIKIKMIISKWFGYENKLDVIVKDMMIEEKMWRNVKELWCKVAKITDKKDFSMDGLIVGRKNGVIVVSDENDEVVFVKM